MFCGVLSSRSRARIVRTSSRLREGHLSRLFVSPSPPRHDSQLLLKCAAKGSISLGARLCRFASCLASAGRAFSAPSRRAARRGAPRFGWDASPRRGGFRVGALRVTSESASREEALPLFDSLAPRLPLARRRTYSRFLASSRRAVASTRARAPTLARSASASAASRPPPPAPGRRRPRSAPRREGKGNPRTAPPLLFARAAAAARASVARVAEPRHASLARARGEHVRAVRRELRDGRGGGAGDVVAGDVVGARGSVRRTEQLGRGGGERAAGGGAALLWLWCARRSVSRTMWLSRCASRTRRSRASAEAGTGAGPRGAARFRGGASRARSASARRLANASRCTHSATRRASAATAGSPSPSPSPFPSASASPAVSPPPCPRPWRASTRDKVLETSSTPRRTALKVCPTAR